MEPPYDEWVVVERARMLEDRVQLLIVRLGRTLEALTDRRVLRAVQRPPSPLEIEDGLFTIGQCHPDSLPARRT